LIAFGDQVARAVQPVQAGFLFLALIICDWFHSLILAQRESVSCVSTEREKP
jgi:hypothetical protein